MGFMWEGSTGERAVQLLKGLPQGTVVDTVDLAARLDVKPGALHQLLANAVKLRMVVKVHIRGHYCVGWRLGPGGDSVTIERRLPQTPLTEAELARRRAITERRKQRGDAKRTTTSHVEAKFAANLPAWLCSAVAPARRGRRAGPTIAHARPASYLARWHVLYRDERGQVHGDIQVQAVHADLGVIDAWCPARGGIDRFTIAGFARVADAETGERVDVQAWLEAPPRARKRKLASAEI
jgi:hypothetical protein